MRSRTDFIDPAPLSRLLAGFTDMLDIRDSEVRVFTPSGLLLFLFLVLFAHLRARHRNFVPEMLREIDGFAMKPVALAVLGCNRVFAGFIALLQAARYRYSLAAFCFCLIFLRRPDHRAKAQRKGKHQNVSSPLSFQNHASTSLSKYGLGNFYIQDRRTAVQRITAS